MTDSGDCRHPSNKGLFLRYVRAPGHGDLDVLGESFTPDCITFPASHALAVLGR